MYLSPSNQKLAADFINGLLWQDIERCLLARRPARADTADPTHVAAAKGHVRAGYELALEELRKLPIEEEPKAINPMAIPAVSIIED